MHTTVRGLKFLVAALLLGGISALAATGLAWVLRPSPTPAPTRQSSLTLPPQLFRDWNKPDLVLILSGEQHGYLLPCGCSRPQYGGLERRYNLIQAIKQKGWPVAAVDLGDIPQREGLHKLPNHQGLIKYRYSMESLREMDYLAVGLGQYEASLSLFTILGEFALNSPTPRVLAANIQDKDTLFPEQLGNAVVKQVPGSPFRVGVAGVIGPSVQEKIKDPNVKFEENAKVIPRIGEDLQRGADLRVLLYQGSLDEAKALAAARKEWHIILCLSPEDEPRQEPTRVGDTQIVGVGHKGRFVGAMGIWRGERKDAPPVMRYQLVSLGEEFMTPSGEEKEHPILQKMERYTQELESQNYLEKVAGTTHPMQVAFPGVVPTFVGSEKCQKCHEQEYEIWEKSRHSHAYDTLLQATKPALRQKDPECIVCHTIGFGYKSGYRNATDTPKLKNVGCESCHGPSSEHVKDSKDSRWYSLMNPWKGKENETPKDKRERFKRMDQFCQSCHDTDNDVNYRFEKRWPPVAHPPYEE